MSIAGLGVSIDSERELRLPAAVGEFAEGSSDTELSVHLKFASRLPQTKARVIYDAAAHWRACVDGSVLVYEMFHPPTDETYCRMETGADRSALTLTFGESNLVRVVTDADAVDDVSGWLPFPFDQLAVVPALARRNGFLTHASAGLIDGTAYVFAGHSGDGKTTLSRLLQADGVELLSDERVAIRKENDGFVVYGTPWHGEGEIVSAARYPLGGVFILRKSARHRIRAGAAVALAAELLSRSIVPYYLAEETHLILQSVQQMAGEIPLRELEFSKEPGLLDVLSRFEPAA